MSRQKSNYSKGHHSSNPKNANESSKRNPASNESSKIIDTEYLAYQYSWEGSEIDGMIEYYHDEQRKNKNGR